MKFELYYPIKPIHVNQPFGNVLPVYTAMGLQGHNGIDFMAAHGQPVYAAHDGNAYWESDGASGEGVVLCSTETFDYNGKQVKFKTIYWHLADPVKEPNLKSPIYGNNIVPVKTGDLIGYADNTGMSTGDHLHFGLKAGEPNEPDGQFINLDSTNGYFGAIDPQPFLNGMFAQDKSNAPVLTPVEQFIFTLILNIKFGTRGVQVKRLQQMLIDTGFSIPAGSTGYFGDQTLEAVNAFIKKHNLY